MASRGRLRTACLTAAASASAVASFAAAPPAGPADLRLPPRYAGEPLPGQGGMRPDARVPGADPRPARPAATPIHGFPALGGARQIPSVGRRGAVREYARPASSGWVALVGEFGKQGCYEIPGESVPLAELLRRCEGLTGQATGTIRLVRGGQPAGTINPTAKVSLRPGDLLVADGTAGGRRFGGVTTASFERAQPAAPAGVRLGVVGATARPLSIKLDANKATVATVIGGLGQSLSPRDVTVLVGGSVRKRGDEVAQLTDGSVVVFDPRTVDVRQVSASGIESQTFYYPVQQAPSELPADAVPQEVAPADAGVTMPVSAPPFAAPSLEAMTVPATDGPSATMSLVPPPPADESLSSLPSVETLAPPADEPPLGYPRTADASGSIPVGPPDVAESHISAVPAETFYGGPSEPRIAMAEPAAPQVPTDSLGPATSSLGPADSAETAIEEEETVEEPSISSLAATVLAGGALGAVTFLILRRLRGRGLPTFASSRLAALVARPAAPAATRPAAIDRPSPVHRPGTTAVAATAATTAGAAPSDMLAALVADRLGFREEPVELPAVMRIFGRSTAVRKRRIDPAAAGVPEPHIPLAAPVVREEAEVRAEAKTAKAAHIRIDPAELPIAAAGLAGGTPFERALAARHRSAAQR